MAIKVKAYLRIFSHRSLNFDLLPFRQILTDFEYQGVVAKVLKCTIQSMAMNLKISKPKTGNIRNKTIVTVPGNIFGDSVTDMNIWALIPSNELRMQG